MGRKLYVGNLPFSAGEAELQRVHSTAGRTDLSLDEDRWIDGFDGFDGTA